MTASSLAAALEGGEPAGFWSFDQAADGFYYYPDNSSAGILVSEDERALYLGGDRRAFFQAIAGRAGTGPKRSRLPHYFRVLAGHNPLVIVFLATIGVRFAFKSLDASYLAGQLLYGLGAAFMLTMALASVLARLWLKHKAPSASDA
jgi:hypothetical protein